MRKNIIHFFIILCIGNWLWCGQDDYLKIDATIDAKSINMEGEGVLKIKITPKNLIKIASHPEFIIKLTDNNDVTFSKIFFTASELDFQTMQENGTVFLEIEKEVEIPFKINQNSLTNKHIISGEVIFTAVFEDSWSLKTLQKFNIQFFSKKNAKSKK